MDGFDKQLRARQENDEALLEHAFASISDAVFGSRTADRFKTDAEKVKTAIDEILFYYRVSTREVPRRSRIWTSSLSTSCVRTALCAKRHPGKRMVSGLNRRAAGHAKIRRARGGVSAFGNVRICVPG